MSVSKDFVELINATNEKGTKAYDTSATVTRVEDSTVWVHIPGGVDETPVKKTINAKAGDVVQVRVSGGSAWLNGNASAPPTDDTKADVAIENAEVANMSATSAVQSAKVAGKAAAEAQASATTAYNAAQNAQISAENASEYAARAFGNLSTVQSVAETLTYITQHGTMTLTSDVALDPTHVYFIQDINGDYEVNSVKYSIVTEPDVADIGTYYELSINESLQNYVGTHLAITSEGLWLLPATSGTNKVLIATGAGSQYTIAGTYLIDGSGNTVASFRSDGATMGTNGVQIAHLGYGAGTDSGGGISDAPFYTLGIRASGSTVGNYSVAEGYNTEASGYSTHAEGLYTTAISQGAHAEGDQSTASAVASHAEGNGTTASSSAAHAEGNYTEASGPYAHAEGSNTKAQNYYSHAEGNETDAVGYGAHAEGRGTAANGLYSHAEGYGTTADGSYSHAQNLGTIAAKLGQTSLGSYNVEDTSQTTTHPSGETQYGQYAVIVGNGTDYTSQSNALTIDWSGNIEATGDITDGTGNVLSSKADTSAIPTATSNLINDSGFISEDANGDISITRNITAGGNIEATGDIMAVGMAGMIQMYGGSTAPTGWLLCNGSAVSRTDYAELFAVIGTNYGAGDGTTTFTLPDMRGMFPLGVSSTHPITGTGSSGGAETVKLTAAQSGVPAHNHGASGLTVSPSGHKIKTNSYALGSGGTSRNIVTSSGSLSTGTVTDGHSISGSVANNTATDATSAHNNMPPYRTVNFIIATGKTS